MLNLAIPYYKVTESQSPEPANSFMILRALRGDRFFGCLLIAIVVIDVEQANPNSQNANRPYTVLPPDALQRSPKDPTDIIEFIICFFHDLLGVCERRTGDVAARRPGQLVRKGDTTMKPFRVFTALSVLALFVSCLPFLRADDWDKATKVTFSESVQVPGKVLPAGTYVFKLLNSAADRHIVQIFNEDHSQLITTVLAIPNQRLEASGKTILTYHERPADQPMALAAWFYPGDTFGQEFAYPKSESEVLSRLNNEQVPSTGSEEAYPTLKERPTDSVAQNTNEAASQNTDVAVSQPPAAQPENPPATAAAAPEPTTSAANTQVPAQQNNAQQETLPHTGSSLAMIGLVGLTLLAFAALMRMTLRA